MNPMHEPKNHLRQFRFPRLSESWDRYLPVFWMVCIGAAFSLAVFFAVRWWEYQDIANVFQLSAQDRALAVKGTFETETAMLDLVRSSLEGDAQVRRKEFRWLVAPFLSRSRSIEAVEWVPRVADSERAKFVAETRREGIEDYRITEMGRDGRMRLASQAERVFPDLFHRPAAGTENGLRLRRRLRADPPRLAPAGLRHGRYGSQRANRFHSGRRKDGRFSRRFARL